MKYCGKCGNELNDDDQYCPKCSTKFVTYNEEMKSEKRTGKNKKKKIVLSIVCAIIAIFGIYIASNWNDFKTGYNSAVNDINQSSTESTSSKSDKLNVSSQKNVDESEKEQSTTSAQIEKTEISDLFSGDLEDAKKVLGDETEAKKNLDSYTMHTFGDIVIMCEYGTSNIYSIAIKYTDDTRERYTAFGLDGNSKKSDWDKRFGDELSSNYNSDGDNIYSYENDYKGNNFGIEFTVSGETPNKITIYKYSNE